MENTELFKKLIRESIKTIEEGTSNCNETSLEAVQDQPGVGKPFEASLEDHIKALKEEREILVRKLENR